MSGQDQKIDGVPPNADFVKIRDGAIRVVIGIALAACGVIVTDNKVVNNKQDNELQNLREWKGHMSVKVAIVDDLKAELLMIRKELQDTAKVLAGISSDVNNIRKDVDDLKKMKDR